MPLQALYTDVPLLLAVTDAAWFVTTPEVAEADDARIERSFNMSFKLFCLCERENLVALDFVEYLIANLAANRLFGLNGELLQIPIDRVPIHGLSLVLKRLTLALIISYSFLVILDGSVKVICGAVINSPSLLIVFHFLILWIFTALQGIKAASPMHLLQFLVAGVVQAL